MKRKLPGWLIAIAIFEFFIGISAIVRVQYFSELEPNQIASQLMALSGIIIGIGLLYMSNFFRVLAIVQIFSILYDFLYSIVLLGNSDLEQEIISQQYTMMFIFSIVYILILRYLLSRRIRSLFNAGGVRDVTLTYPEYNKLKAHTHAGLGRVYMKTSKPDYAVSQFVNAIQLGFQFDDGEMKAVCSYCLRRKMLNSNVIDIYTALLKRLPKNDPEYIRVNRFLSDMCTIAETGNNNDLHTRTGYLDKILRSLPQLDWANYYRGLSFFRAGRFNDAITRFTRAKKLRFDNILIDYWLGMSYLNLSNKTGSKHQATTVQFLEAFVEDSISGSAKGIEKKVAAAAYELTRMTLPRNSVNDSAYILKSHHKPLFDKALGYMKAAVTSSPENAEYRFYYGRILSVLGRCETALSEFKIAATAKSGNKQFQFFLANECWKTDNVAESLKYVKKTIAIDDSYAPAVFLFIRLLIHLDQFSEAEKMIQENPLSTTVQKQLDILKIEVLFHLGKYEEAIILSESIPLSADKSASSLEAFYCIGRSYAKLKRYAEAQAYYEKLPEGHRRSYYRGAALMRMGKGNEALEDFISVIRKNEENHSTAVPGLKPTSSQQSEKNPEEPIPSREQKTISEFIKILENAYIRTGQIYMADEKFTGAKENFLKALSMNPDRPESALSMGFLLYTSQEYEESLKFFQSVLRSDKENSAAHLGLAFIYERMDQIEEAILEYELTGSPGNMPEQAMERLGVLYCKTKSFEKSVGLLNPLYQRSNRSDTVLFYLGLAFYNLNDYKPALQCWEELQKSYPDDERIESYIAGLHYLQGKKYMNENKLEAAASAWEKYLSCYPKDDKTRLNIAEIYFRISINLLKHNKESELSNVLGFLAKAKELDDTNSRYDFYLAVCKAKMGEFSVSLAILNNLNGNIASERIDYLRAITLLSTGEEERGIALLQQMLDEKPELSFKESAKAVLSNEYIIKGEFPKVLSLFETEK